MVVVTVISGRHRRTTLRWRCTVEPAGGSDQPTSDPFVVGEDYKTA